ncbi:GntR family transcriptional regulator [Clostridium omnivorum]|uniref:GntR family transcriptional regulator n=1 Tax=Clostridium omnivorum TaxID=1604902 RepID=A0ABQ5N9V9_9CLOT|nr:GntR family transcriptional regulator [Clostridium sp. E14]GLC31867.1 GntR family transcriptional regulator [Clostridium sp. E14]
MLDKNSSVPIYVQLEEVVKDKIKNREYLPGEELPTERELTELYGVSRMTIRQVITNLVHKGILYRIPGKGAFVSKEVIEKKLEIESFSEDMRKRGLVPGSKVIEFEKVEPSDEIREKLKLPKGEQIYLLNRLRLADDEPMAIEYCYLPEKFFPNIIKYNMVHCSLYTIMKEEYNIHFNYMKQSLKAANLNKKEAEMLLGKPKGVGLVSERLMYNIEEVPIEFTKTIYNAERYTFNMVLFNNNN